jgi:hypothetical protein
MPHLWSGPKAASKDGIQHRFNARVWSHVWQKRYDRRQKHRRLLDIGKGWTYSRRLSSSELGLLASCVSSKAWRLRKTLIARRKDGAMRIPIERSWRTSTQYQKMVALHLKEMSSSKIHETFESAARPSNPLDELHDAVSQVQLSLQQGYRRGELHLSMSYSNRHTSNYFSLILNMRLDHISGHRSCLFFPPCIEKTIGTVWF